MNEQIRIAIPLIPHQSGVYQMFDNTNRIIYIGKAKDLYKRISQYFYRPQSGKVLAMVMHVAYFKYIITNNEKEALILEMNLIHEHMPRYNILLKDGSHYPYIGLSKNKQPILRIMRNRKDNNYYYFGPYPNSASAYQVINLLNKIFPLRKCKTLPKVSCIYKDLGQCLAPCVNKINNEEYLEMSKKIRAFFAHNNKDIKLDIKNKMLECSEKEQYEKANEYKNILLSIEKISENQAVENPHFKSIDALAFSYRDSYLSLTISTYRNAILLGQNNFIVPAMFENEDEIIHLIEQYYSTHELPHLLAINLKDSKELEDLLGVKVISAKRGAIYEALLISENNAKETLDNHFLTARLTDDNFKLLEDLGKLLKIKTPYHIELIDNSHLQGSDPVSALIAYINGRPNKKLYRKFHIEGRGNDDFKSMNEVLNRHYKRLVEENAPMPDLILLDGGLPQLKAIKDKYPFPIFGLYKDDKHRTKGIIDEEGKIYNIDNKSPLFFLLMRMQDEVHRFAISFHQKERNKHMIKSIFDDIKGLGKKRIEIVMKHYKSIDELKKASEYELCQLLPKEIAGLLYSRLHE